MNIENVLSDFQITGHTVKKINLKNDFAELSSNEKYKKTVRTSHEINEVEKLEKYWIGIITLNVSSTIKKDPKAKLLCDVSIEGAFIAPPDMEESDFIAMLALNGCSTLYSIARSLIVSITSQALVDGKVLLPMVNFFKYTKE